MDILTLVLVVAGLGGIGTLIDRWGPQYLPQRVETALAVVLLGVFVVASIADLRG